MYYIIYIVTAEYALYILLCVIPVSDMAARDRFILPAAQRSSD
jgi:hypothetical protein